MSSARAATKLACAPPLILAACSSMADLGVGAQSVGGELFGLTPGESITLRSSSGENLTLSSNGAFAFRSPIAAGSAYQVTIQTPPSSPLVQTCTLSDASGVVGTAPITNVTVACDLLAYFPFDGNANDESGYGHDGVVNGATLTADRDGNANAAYAFAGTATIQASVPAGFLPNNDEPRTLTAWLMPSESNSAWDVVFWGTGNCTGNQFGLGDVSDSAAFWSGCNDYQSALAIPVNQWTFVAIVYTPAIPSSVTLYVDNLSATGTVIALRTPGSGDLVMGGSVVASASMFFSGNIDSVRVYGRALGPDEVESLAAAKDP